MSGGPQGVVFRLQPIAAPQPIVSPEGNGGDVCDARLQASANIRDAVHPRLMRLERHAILRDDVAKPAPGLS